MPVRKPVSDLARHRMRKAKLSHKQMRFVREYAELGNGAEAARRAGYKPKAAKEIAHENLTKPHVASAVEAESLRLAAEISPQRVQARLDRISHAAEEAGQFGPAVRAEELLGKSIGMWIDLQLSGEMNDSHISALLGIARARQLEHVDNADSDDD